MNKQTKSWLIGLAIFLLIVGLALAPLAAGFCNYVRIFDVHACTVNWSEK